MKYAIVYSSPTGNTRMLAEALAAALPEGDCLYVGAPDEAALAADQVYVGFWTDKGNCDEKSAAFLTRLTTQRVFFFGTAGFGGSAAYFEEILQRVKQQLPAGVQVVGTYMCQGKMPMAVRHRYEAMEDSPRKQEMLDNFDRALAHPNEEDLQTLQEMVQKRW
ncbi:MAG: flavodoxin family protein BilS [Eubacteriales bacterium]|jgi:flavodoxin I